MKVYVVETIYHYDGQVDTNIVVFDTFEKAKKYKQVEIDKANHFIEDIKRDIDDGNEDSIIEDKETYFYAYDSYNFDEYTISINEREVE